MSPKIGSDYPDYMALRLEPGMRKRIEELAKAEERPPSAMARIILREGLEAREAKRARKKE
jgi:predicted transcriptional regulator